MSSNSEQGEEEARAAVTALEKEAMELHAKARDYNIAGRFKGKHR